MVIHCTAAERGGWIENKESSDVNLKALSGGLMMLLMMMMMMMMMAALYHCSDF